MISILRRNAERRPDALAVSFAGQNTSFGQALECAESLARAFTNAGLARGDRIAILSRNSSQMMEVYAACERGRFIAVPINFRLTTTEIAWVIENTSPSAIVYAPQWSETLTELNALIGTDTLLVRMGEATGSAESSRSEPYVAFRDGVAGNVPLPEPEPEDPLYIIHTTGTTGRPKGAVLTQSSMYHAGAAIAEDGELTSRDRALLLQPLFHVGAKFAQTAWHLRGASIFLEADFDPTAVWRRLVLERITSTQLAPAMIQMLLDSPAAQTAPGAEDLHLRSLFYSTGPIRESLLRRAIARLGLVFIQHYGSTEAGVVTTLRRSQHRPDGTPEEQAWLASAGRAAPGVELRITGQNRIPLKDGEIGDIEVRTGSLLHSYWNNPAASARAFTDGWFATGDIGVLDDAGFLRIVDRKHDMIISGGENVYPREVEDIVNAHPAVHECAIIAVPDDKWGEGVHAVLVMEPGRVLSVDELNAYCRDRLASYKCPRSAESVEELPRLANGKIDKRSLRAAHWPTQR